VGWLAYRDTKLSPRSHSPLLDYSLSLKVVLVNQSVIGDWLATGENHSMRIDQREPTVYACKALAERDAHELLIGDICGDGQEWSYTVEPWNGLTEGSIKGEGHALTRRTGLQLHVIAVADETGAALGYW